MAPPLPDSVAGPQRDDSRRPLAAAARGFFADLNPADGRSSPGRSRLTGRLLRAAGYVALLALVAWWGWRAFHDPYTRDTGLAWRAGSLGWSTGHPEQLGTWNGMTFLAAGMAIVSRVFSERQTADLVTAVNIVIAIAALVLVLGRMRGLLRPVWWWTAALGLISFGPLLSSVWWKQFNLMALGLAVSGFELARQRRPKLAALAIGLSISIKPLAFLLPVAMLARRETRRVGAMAIAWIAALNVVAQALMAARAHDLATLDPTIGLRNLIHKTSAAGNIFLCSSLNFSPTSSLCRLNGGFHYWTLQRIIAIVLIGLLALWVAEVLRSRSALGWEVLAFACPLTVMVSALAWPHYQIMLAPLFLLLLCRFVREGAQPAEWAGLAIAFIMASMMWEPYGTIVNGLRSLPDNPAQTNLIEQYAQFAQYLLVLTGLLWYRRQRPRVIEPAIGGPGQDHAGSALRPVGRSERVRDRAQVARRWTGKLYGR